MTGFLDVVASIALGTSPAGAARPSLPSRFAASPSLIGEGDQGWGAFEETDAPALRTAPPPPAAHERQARGHERNRIALPVAEMARRDDSKPGRLGLAGGAQAARHLSDEAAREAQAEAGVPLPAAHISGQPLRRIRPAFSQVTPDRFPFEEPAMRTLTRAAPLSAAAVAGRAGTASEERPVIHVTIDRIEVRAPAPPKPAVEQRRPRREPAVPLSRYLSESGGGGRG